VRDFELWNEPNLPGSWGGRPPDAVHYARLVREAAPLIHRLRPGARVLAGAVAGVDPAPYVRCLFEVGGLRANDFDAFSVHAYPRATAGRVEAPTRDSAVVEQARAAADAVHAYAPGARIWITETGVSTTGPDAVSPREQARATCATWRALRRQPGVDAVIFHTLFDAPMFPASSPERGYGWVALDARVRPRAKPVLGVPARATARAAGSCA